MYTVIVYRMEFDKTRWSYPWNIDQKCTQNSAKSGMGSKGEWCSVGEGGGVSDIRTQVEALIIDIAERTINCESLLLKVIWKNNLCDVIF